MHDYISYENKKLNSIVISGWPAVGKTTLVFWQKNWDIDNIMEEMF